MFSTRISLIITSLLLSLLVTFSCKDEKAVDSTKEQVIDLSTPENVCLRWTQLLDSNKISEAKLLATDSAKTWLDAYGMMLSSTKSDTAYAKTTFDTIYCKAQRDSCTCYYLIKIVDGDQLRDSFLLVKINGAWKMGVPPVVQDEIFLDQDEERATANQPIK